MVPLPEQGKLEGRRPRWLNKTRRKSLEAALTSECNTTAGLLPQCLLLERREGQTPLRSKWLGAMAEVKSSSFESNIFYGMSFFNFGILLVVNFLYNHALLLRLEQGRKLLWICTV